MLVRRTLAREVIVDRGPRYTGPLGQAQDPSAAAFLSTAAAECATWPQLRDPEYDPITTVRVFLTRAVRAAAQRGELHADLEHGPLIETLVALLCGVWVYIGYLGPEHEAAITSTLRRFLTGLLATLPENPALAASSWQAAVGNNKRPGELSLSSRGRAQDGVR